MYEENIENRKQNKKQKWFSSTIRPVTRNAPADETCERYRLNQNAPAFVYI